MTEKLYDKDSHLKSFEAKVLSCEAADGLYRVLLDRTAFFPEGGGQPSDTGIIDGVKVLYVKEDAGNIYHYTQNPLAENSDIIGEIDWSVRYDRMQNHSGEHIISGIVHNLYGYENVGFHLSDSTVTLDFDGDLTSEQLSEIELLANEVVWRNAAFKTYYPKSDELQKLNYRSKKEISGDVRIVEIEDCDICACCAPHVKSAGEIGIIKMLDTEKIRGGIRIYIKCGIRALADYGERYKNEAEISNLLSVKQNETVEGTKKLFAQIDELKATNLSLKKRVVETLIQSAGECDTALFVSDFDIRSLQMLADGLCQRFKDTRGVFCAVDSGNVYSFAICGSDKELEQIMGRFRNQFAVRGGGRNGMVQGTVTGDKEKIKLFFNNL